MKYEMSWIASTPAPPQFSRANSILLARLMDLYGIKTLDIGMSVAFPSVLYGRSNWSFSFPYGL